MTKVLITDPIDQTGIDILSQVAQVDQKIGISNSELASIIHDYDALMIRSVSYTHLTLPTIYSV